MGQIDIEASPLQIIHRLAQHASSIFKRYAGDTTLTERRVVILAAIAASDGAPSQSEIITHTGIDRSTLASVMREIEKLGWIQRRRREDDTRSYHITLTAEGKAMLRAGTQILAAVDADLAAMFSRRSWEQLRRVLTC